MLELSWYNDAHAQASASETSSDASCSSTQTARSSQKPADEQYRSALRAAIKNLTSEKGGLLKSPVVLPCGHVGDRYEAEYLFKQKEAFLKRAERPNQAPERKAQLLASARKTYVCIQCPADVRKDIGKKPDELSSEPRIGHFVSAFNRYVPDGLDEASAAALELLKSDLREAKVRIPKLPDATPKPEPEQAAYNCAIGESLVHEGKLAEAETWFRAAVTADPEHRTYNHNMGVCLTKLNKKADAVPYLQRANIDPQRHPRQAELSGYNLLVAGRFAEAETFFRQALAHEPLSSRLHSFVGTCVSGQGKHQEAYTHYNKALSMRPEHPKFQRDVGYSLFMLGRFSEAETHLLKAHESDPKNARFIYELSWCNRKMKRMHTAEALLKKAVECEPDNAVYNNDLGMLYFIQKFYFIARPFFAQAKASAPNDTRYAEHLAACDQKIDKKTKPFMDRFIATVDKFFPD